ncbi:MAG TPA: hypothetical protein PLU88_12375 [Armatimonadota bacterium]|nr:hypothetical protein [Armatimonadota bacterium]
MNDLGLGIIVSLKDAFTQNASRVQSSMETLDASVAKSSENMTKNLGLIERGMEAIKRLRFAYSSPPAQADRAGTG